MIETIVITVVGLVLTVLISRYYYQLSVRNRLSVYALQAFRVLSDLDSKTRAAFSVQFHSTEVKNLSVIELLVVNEGTNPIRDCVEPLTIAFPDDVSLLDAAVPYAYPEGRKVEAQMKSSGVFECRFDLLNPREYFLVKVIADGRFKPDDLVMSIAAENLPPRLKPRLGAHIATRRKSRLTVPLALLAGLFYVAACGFLITLLSLLERIRPTIVPSWLHVRLSFFPAGLTADVVALLTVASAITALVFVISSFFGGSIPRTRHFPLPESFSNRDQPIIFGPGIELWGGRWEDDGE